MTKSVSIFDLQRDYGKQLEGFKDIPEEFWPEEMLMLLRYKKAWRALPKGYKKIFGGAIEDSARIKPAQICLEELEIALMALEMKGIASDEAYEDLQAKVREIYADGNIMKVTDFMLEFYKNTSGSDISR